MMTRADHSLHDVPSAAVLEQITRWAITDRFSGRGRTDHAADAVHAAAEGSREDFHAAIANLADHDGPGSHAAMLQASLWGNPDAVHYALADNEGLRALYRTVAQRADGVDMAEIATPNGLRLRAEQTGAEYQTAILVEDEPGRSDLLASSAVVAATAPDALRTATEREHAVHGLDQSDLNLVDRQLARLEQLTSQHPNPAGPGPVEKPEPGDRWASIVAEVTGEDLQAQPGWTTLAATLDRAANAGWNVEQQLPAVVAAAPLPVHGSAVHELAYRVMDACPDAVPPTPSVAQINGTEIRASGRQREAGERAISPTPAPGRGPTVGR